MDILDVNGQLLATSNPVLDQQIENWLEVRGVSEALQNRVDRNISASSKFGQGTTLTIGLPLPKSGYEHESYV
jgi:hypothetical protein